MRWVEGNQWICGELDREVFPLSIPGRGSYICILSHARSGVVVDSVC
jgi:hypothetical protein